MTDALNYLPSEIIELISSNTSTQDLLQVILVSKSWYQLFYNFIYRSLSIDNYDKQQRTLAAFCTGKLPGHYVKSLSLKSIQLSEKEVVSLPKLFPAVDTLEMDWNIWGPLPFHTYFDSEAPISYIHPPRGLPPCVHQLFDYYGFRNLRSLTIDALNHDSVDVWSILALCPRLKTLKLLNLNHEHVVTLGYLETIHQLCSQLTSLTIKCTQSDPNPALLPQFSQHDYGQIVLTPSVLEFFSLASKSGSAKWPYWLPYFSVKYPYLQHIQFKHCGLGKDGGGNGAIPERVFTLFTHGCRRLKSIRWNKIIVQQDQQKGLFSLCDQHHEKQQTQPFLYLERIEAYENFQIPNSLHYSPLVQPHNLMSSLLTSLTIGQPPANVRTAQVIKVLGQCPNLAHLKIQECFSDPDLAYNIDDILKYCRHLQSLYVKDVHLVAECNTELQQQQQQQQHPLKKLVLKRSSFVEGVFEKLSKSCAGLDHVELLGCVQSDRRDQVGILLPRQNLTMLKVQGLRTRCYYAGCRIRFFEVNRDWYYMSKFDIRTHAVGRKMAFQKYRNMEFGHSFDRLDDRDIQELRSLVTTQVLKAWDIEAVKRNLQARSINTSSWDPENIYYSGVVKIEFNSIQNLEINHKRII